MRSDIERLAKSYLRAAITVTIGDEESSRNKRIQQDIIMIKEGQKAVRASRGRCACATLTAAPPQRKLMEVLRGATPPIIIFVNLRKNCDVLSRQLEQAGATPATPRAALPCAAAAAPASPLAHAAPQCRLQLHRAARRQVSGSARGCAGRLPRRRVRAIRCLPPPAAAFDPPPPLLHCQV